MRCRLFTFHLDFEMDGGTEWFGFTVDVLSTSGLLYLKSTFFLTRSAL